MEIYIAVLEEDARQANKEPDLKAVGDRDEGMRKEHEHACLIAQDCLAEHQNMSNIRNGLSINDTQQPTAPLIQQYPTTCLLYTSPSPRDRQKSRMPSSA